MLFIIHVSYIFLIQPLLEARAEIQKYFCSFLVQKKSLDFAFEINWPLELKLAIQIRKIWAALEYKIVDLKPPNELINSGIYVLLDIVFLFWRNVFNRYWTPLSCKYLKIDWHFFYISDICFTICSVISQKKSLSKYLQFLDKDSQIIEFGTPNAKR